MTENTFDIVLKVLNDDSSSFIHLTDHDRKRIAQEIVNKLDETIGKRLSEEIEQTLNFIEEIGSLYNQLKKIPFYHFRERNEIKYKIEELRIKKRGW